MMQPEVLTIWTEERGYPNDGNYVYLGSAFIGIRPYDGSDDSQIASQVADTLAELVAERLGWEKI